jgi:hypothetical protein
MLIKNVVIKKTTVALQMPETRSQDLEDFQEISVDDEKNEDMPSAHSVLHKEPRNVLSHKELL